RSYLSATTWARFLSISRVVRRCCLPDASRKAAIQYLLVGTFTRLAIVTHYYNATSRFVEFCRLSSSGFVNVRGCSCLGLLRASTVFGECLRNGSNGRHIPSLE